MSSSHLDNHGIPGCSFILGHIPIDSHLNTLHGMLHDKNPIKYQGDTNCKNKCMVLPELSEVGLMIVQKSGTRLAV